uniref:TSA: Wollemia nobilis Ref_Wollemi_Transcript_25401_2356 transcribed RNA sequence n=1 Tax=Wollemia nobilis TaxID=56998 RepID=A0A0C9QM09_9CONI
MATPQIAVETFMSITGASEAVAVEKLQAHGGNLNEAVNAYFNEGEHVLRRPDRVEAPQPDWMEVDDQTEVTNPLHPLPARGPIFNPYRLPGVGLVGMFEGRSAFDVPSQSISRPRNVRNIPIESNDEGDQIVDRTSAPVIEELPTSVNTQGADIRGTVILDDDDLPSTASSNYREGLIARCGSYNPGTYIHGGEFMPSAPRVTEEPMVSNDEGNDIEEEMLRAAIEASKREAEEEIRRHQHGINEEQIGSRVDQNTPRVEDDDYERALSLSLKTAEQEKERREREGMVGLSQQEGIAASSLSEREGPNTERRQGPDSTSVGTSSQLKLDDTRQHASMDIYDAGPPEETEEPDEQPLLRRRSMRRTTSGAAEIATQIGQNLDAPPPSPGEHSIASAPQLNGDPFHEWGGISSQEHDEAVMLEAALFGGIPHDSAYQFGYPDIGAAEAYRRRIPRPPSPTLEAQRLLREQQDDEYLASLQADREKAEAQRLEEEAAREAAAAEEKRQQEEELRRLQEEEESERQLAAKKAALPPEPLTDDENAVTLLVRMPDGTRRGRRFLKSDRLQSLFDFIDVGGGVKPGTYRLVRQYPRRAFTDVEQGSSLSDLGLMSKQEALFLELI